MSIQIIPAPPKIQIPTLKWGLTPVFSDKVYEDILMTSQNGYMIWHQRIVFSKNTLEPRLVIAYTNHPNLEIIIKSYDPNGNIVGTKTLTGPFDGNISGYDFRTITPWYVYKGSGTLVDHVYDGDLNEYDSSLFSKEYTPVHLLVLDEETKNIDHFGLNKFIINGIEYRVEITCLDYATCTTKVYRDDTQIYSIDQNTLEIFIVSGKVLLLLEDRLYVIPDETENIGAVSLSGGKHISLPLLDKNLLVFKYNYIVKKFTLSTSDYLPFNCYKGICGKGIIDLMNNRVLMLLPEDGMNMLYYYELE